MAGSGGGRAGAPNALGRRGLRGPGLRPLLLLPRAPPRAAIPRARFIFEGIEGEILGDFGTSPGAAPPGSRLDAFNASLGSPTRALVVASSEDHSNAFQLVNEEMNVSVRGRRRAVLARGAGRHWSSTSIPAAGPSSRRAPSPTWGASAHKGYDNNYRRA